MWNGHDVSVVLMTYAERDSIRDVIERFFQTGVVDEVVVVDNNAQAGTREEVEKTQARIVYEPVKATVTPLGGACAKRAATSSLWRSPTAHSGPRTS